MKPFICIIILLTAATCFAQAGKDTTSKAGRKGNETKNRKIEKQEVIPLNEDKVIGNPNVYKIIAETEYYQDMKKPLLKDVFEKSLKTDRDVINENVKGILADVQRSNEDKRSTLLKTVQSALTIAGSAAALALGAREIVREVQGKNKK